MKTTIRFNLLPFIEVLMALFLFNDFCFNEFSFHLDLHLNNK